MPAIKVISTHIFNALPNNNMGASVPHSKPARQDESPDSTCATAASPARVKIADSGRSRTAAFQRIHTASANDRLRKEKNMDIEHINAIGASLTDLTARTAALRGYL